MLLKNTLITSISSYCKPLKTNLSGEICTYATWAKLFLPNIDPHCWLISATAQLENVYYYEVSFRNTKNMLEDLKMMLLQIKSSWIP